MVADLERHLFSESLDPLLVTFNKVEGLQKFLATLFLVEHDQVTDSEIRRNHQLVDIHQGNLVFLFLTLNMVRKRYNSPLKYCNLRKFYIKKEEKTTNK